jgi:hypothetical protein
VDVDGAPCGKYFVVMLPQWLPLLLEAGDLDRPFVTPEAVDEVRRMSAATVDRYLAPARAAFELKGRSATRPGLLLRNSITIRKAGDELADVPGMLECDTVAHCGRALQGEFARTLTMTDMSTGWTECGLHPQQRVEMAAWGRGGAPRVILVPRDGVRLGLDVGITRTTDRSSSAARSPTGRRTALGWHSSRPAPRGTTGTSSRSTHASATSA